MRTEFVYTFMLIHNLWIKLRCYSHDTIQNSFWAPFIISHQKTSDTWRITGWIREREENTAQKRTITRNQNTFRVNTLVLRPQNQKLFSSSYSFVFEWVYRGTMRTSFLAPQFNNLTVLHFNALQQPATKNARFTMFIAPHAFTVWMALSTLWSVFLLFGHFHFASGKKMASRKDSFYVDASTVSAVKKFHEYRSL